MPHPTPIPASLLEVDLHPGKPPILHTDTPDDAPAWAAEHHHALRTLVTEHGAALVRGLHLREKDQADAVLHRLAPALMTDKEAFARRTARGTRRHGRAAAPGRVPAVRGVSAG